jgi:hypothetical protein
MVLLPGYNECFVTDIIAEGPAKALQSFGFTMRDEAR